MGGCLDLDTTGGFWTVEEDQGWCEQEVQVPGAEGQEGRGEKGEGLGNGGLLCCMLGFRSDRSDSGMAGIYGMLARK